MMEPMFYTLQEFMTHTKNIVYLIMGGILVVMPLIWLFLTDKDEEKPRF